MKWEVPAIVLVLTAGMAASIVHPDAPATETGQPQPTIVPPPEGYVVLPGPMTPLLTKASEADEEYQAYWAALGLTPYPDAAVYVTDREATKTWTEQQTQTAGTEEVKPESPVFREIVRLMEQAMWPKYVLETEDSLEVIRQWGVENLTGWAVGEIEQLDFAITMTGAGVSPAEEAAPEAPGQQADNAPPDAGQGAPEAAGTSAAEPTADNKMGFLVEHAEREGLTLLILDYPDHGKRYLMVTDSLAMGGGIGAVVLVLMSTAVGDMAVALTEGVTDEADQGLNERVKAGLSEEVEKSLQDLLDELTSRPGPEIPGGAPTHQAGAGDAPGGGQD